MALSAETDLWGDLVQSDNGSYERIKLDLAVSDPSQLLSLRDWLHAQPGIEVAVTPGIPGPAEQGALDVVSVVAGSSGLVAAIKILPEFIRSRRSDFQIEITVGDQKTSVSGTNVDRVLPMLERLLLERADGGSD